MDPALTPFAQWIYDGLRPLAEPYDKARGYPLAALADGLGSMFEGTRAMVSDIPDRPQIKNLHPSPYPVGGRRGSVDPASALGTSTHEVVKNPTRPAGPPWVWRDTRTASTLGIPYRTPSVTVKPSTKYTLAVWARVLTPGLNGRIRLDMGTLTGSTQTIPGDGEWRRIKQVHTTTAGTTTSYFLTNWDNGAGEALEFEVTGFTWVEGTEDPGAFGPEDWDCVADGVIGYSTTTRLGSIPGIARQMNPDTADGDWLAWLGQFVGVKVTGPLQVLDYKNLIIRPSFEHASNGVAVGGSWSSSASSTHINYITNPSLETNANGWSAPAYTLTRVASPAPLAGRGGFALQSQFNTGADTNVASFAFVVPGSSDSNLDGGMDVYIPSSWNGGALTVQFEAFTGAINPGIGSANMALRDQWQRVNCAIDALGTDLNGSLVLRAASQPSSGATGIIYVDGAMATAGWTGADMPYFDGDSLGHQWTGTAHASTSTTLAAATLGDNTWSKSGLMSGRTKLTRDDHQATTTRTPIGTSGFPVTAAKTYGGRFDYRFNSIPALNAWVRARFYWFDSGGAQIGTSDGTQVLSVVQGQEGTLKIAAVAPASAAFGSLAFLTDADSPYVLDVNIDAFLAVELQPGSSEGDVPAYFDGDMSGAGWDGVARASTSTLYRFETDAEMRARVSPEIKNPSHYRRGTVPAIMDEVTKRLNTGATAFITERVASSAYNGTIAVLNSSIKAGETVATIQAAVNKVKPAGRIITVSGITGGDWQSLRDTHTDWNDVRSTFVDWAEVRSNPTKQ